MAIQCNFIISPVTETEGFNRRALPYNFINNNYMRTKRSNVEPFDCEEAVLPQDKNYTYVPV